MTRTTDASALLVYRKNPAAWIEDVLGRPLWSKQAQIARAVARSREVAVASCHGIGKSYLGGCIALWGLYNFAPGIVLSTAPTQRQVEGILWKEIRTAHRAARFPLGGRVLTTEIQLAEDWWALGFTTRDTDATRFQGFHAPFVLAILDEAAGVGQEVHVGVDAVLSGGRTHKFMIGNPTDPTSEFAAAFKRDNVVKFSVSAFDTPNFTTFGITLEDIRSGEWLEKVQGRKLPFPSLITPEWVADKWKKWCGGSVQGETDPRWLARVMGKFPEEGSNQTVPLAWMLAANERAETNAAPTTGVKVISCDVARYGGDEIATGLRHGWRFRMLHTTTKQDTMETTGRLVRFAKEHDADEIRVDVIGIGSGVVDRLKELRGQGEFRAEVIGVNVGVSATNREEHVLLRDEMFKGLRDYFDPTQPGGALIEVVADEDLVGQVTALGYKISSNGKWCAESKDDFKKRTKMSSPDRADCMAIAFANLSPSPLVFV